MSIELEEERLQWNYNIPITAKFKIIKSLDCNLCSEENLIAWLSPYLYAELPFDVLSTIIYRKFGIIVDENSLAEHKKHVLIVYKTDNDIKEAAIKDFETIMSDVNSDDVDEKKAMDSCIRSLYARKLLFEKEGNVGRDYLMTCDELRKYIEMKLKLKKELPDETVKINLSDIIKMG